jgi:tryptophan-associated transmembrane protein
VAVTARPPPLPDLRTEHTGGELRAWLPACGWVALAGAGALVATRAAARRLVGGLLVVSGLGIAGAAIGADLTAGWPLLAVAGGLAVAAAGALAVARGDRWPAMGTRYERTRPDQASETDLWRALDRGEDPTAQ